MDTISQIIQELAPLIPTESETYVLECLLMGKEASSGVVDPPEAHELKGGYDRKSTVRAEFIKRLCTSPLAATRLTRFGIQLRGYGIEGELDLASMTIPFSLTCRNCSFKEGINLQNASVTSLDLADSFSAGIRASGLKVAGELRLSEGFVSDEPVCLKGARIGGDLTCLGGRFGYPTKRGRPCSPDYGCEDCRSLLLDAYVLILEHARVDGTIYLCGNFRAEGGVQLTDASIGINLNCTKGTFHAVPSTSNTDMQENGRRLCCEGEVARHSACALNADGLHVKGNIIMNKISARGEVRLTGAVIDGDVESAGGVFQPFGAEAIYADRLHVGGNVFFCDGFRAEGIVRFSSARIGTDLSFYHAELKFGEHSSLPEQNSIILNGEAMTIGGSIYLSHFQATGCVRLSFSTIGGNLNSTHSTFRNLHGPSIEAYSMHIRGSINLDEAFSAEGIVKFTGSEIDGNFMGTDAQFKSHDPCALNLNGSTIGGKVRMDGSFRADGGICLDNSKIGSYWRCDGGSFLAPPRKEGTDKEVYAISGGRLQVGGSVYFDWYLDNRFSAEGEIMLNDFSSERNLKCTGAKLSNLGGYTLRGCQMKIAGSVILSKKFVSRGAVVIDGASIGKSLVCSGGEFDNPGGKSGGNGARKPLNFALSADGTQIGGDVRLNDGFCARGPVSLVRAAIGGRLTWVGVQEAQEAELDLRSASAEVLEDESECWPRKIHLNGFAYQFLNNPSANIEARTKTWLKNSGRFRPQPYEHLAAVLKRTGYDRESQQVLICKNKEEARLPVRWPLIGVLPSRRSKDESRSGMEDQTQGVGMFIWMRILEWCVCYGYQSKRAILAGLFLTVVGSAFYSYGLTHRFLVASDKDGRISYQNYSSWENRSPKFLSVMYSLDTSIPAMNLQVHDHYLENPKLETPWVNLYRIFHGVHTILGWLVTILFGAALAGIVRR